MEQQGDGMIFTLYTVIGDFSRVRNTFIDLLAPVAKMVSGNAVGENGGEQTTIRLQDDSELSILVRYSKEYIGQQISGMIHFFAGVKCANAELHKNVLSQIGAFNCIAGIVFQTNESQSRTEYLTGTVFQAAKRLNALVLLPSLELYNGDGKLVLSSEGESDFENYIPVGNSDFLDKESGEEDVRDKARKERSFDILKGKGISFLPHLRAAVMEQDAEIRSAGQIARRLFAMFAVCVYCEAVQQGPRNEALRYVSAVDRLADGGLRDYLTEKEKAFLDTEKPEKHVIVDFCWRYECCYVLMWALGYMDQLHEPDHICDVSAMAKTIWGSESIDKFIKDAKLRSRDELLDAADLIVRYDWACVEARVSQRQMPAGLDGGVVYERHYAFNWLIGANNRADWDNIRTHT